MKSIIFAFALIAAVSCDVSHVVQGDGWYKDETGYHYTEPATKFDAPLDVPAPVEQVVADEPVVAEEPVYDTPLVVNEIVEEAPAPYADPVVEVVEVVETPVSNLREYLPPKQDELKRKRQAPQRKVIRKVYRRFVRQSQKKRL